MASSRDASVTNASFHTASRSACFETTVPGCPTSAARTPSARGGSGTSAVPRQRPLPESNRKGPNVVILQVSLRQPSGLLPLLQLIVAGEVRPVSSTGGGRRVLFATKSIDDLKARAAGEAKLKRVLGPVDLSMLGIGAIIGTGIFVLTGQAAAAHAGPAIVLSMVLAGVVSALAALCYAEFASAVPVAGSAYTYGYATLGEFIAWIIGWDLDSRIRPRRGNGSRRLVGLCRQLSGRLGRPVPATSECGARHGRRVG